MAIVASDLPDIAWFRPMTCLPFCSEAGARCDETQTTGTNDESQQ